MHPCCALKRLFPAEKTILRFAGLSWFEMVYLIFLLGQAGDHAAVTSIHGKFGELRLANLYPRGLHYVLAKGNLRP